MTAWHTFETSSRLIREAIKLGTMNARDDGHFTWTPLLLDQVGWQTVVAGIDGLSRHVADEQISVASRLARSGEQPIPTTVVLGAFESPQGPNQVRSPGNDRWRDPIAVPAGVVESPPSFSSQAQALAGPKLRLDIMEQVGKRDLSPRLFVKEHGGGSILDVERHFEVLRKHGWLGLVEPEESSRPLARADYLYRISRAPAFDTDVWSSLPGSIRSVFSAKVFDSYARRVEEAMEAETLDARDDRRYSCTTVPLDRLGWEKLIARTDTLFKFLFGEQARAMLRLGQSGEKPFITTVVLMAFESPGGPPKPPRPLGHLQRATPLYRPATSWPTLRLLK
jgi:hypothetical protein